MSRYGQHPNPDYDRHPRCFALSQTEVAAVMTARGYKMSRAAVQQTEMRALRKIKDAAPELFEFWEELLSHKQQDQEKIH